MVLRASEEKRQEWIDRLDRHRSSGLSISAFCVKESISEANFYAWKRKLTRRQSPSIKPQFVQLRASSHPSSYVEVTMPHGTVIRVPSDQLDAVVAVAKVFALSCVDNGERDHA